jgi:dolichol-phosphate mannosyltransferase
MDDDAEDYIRAIPQFWQKIEGGFDVVSGQRACRHEAGLIRQMLIRCVNLAIGLLSQKKYSDATSSFKMFKRDLLENVLKKSKGNLLIPEFVMLKGKKVEEVLLPQKHSKGRSKSRYTLKKFMTHGLMLFGSFYMIFCNEGRLDSKNTSRQTILENIGKTVGIDRY